MRCLVKVGAVDLMGKGRQVGSGKEGLGSRTFTSHKPLSNYSRGKLHFDFIIFGKLSLEGGNPTVPRPLYETLYRIAVSPCILPFSSESGSGALYYVAHLLMLCLGEGGASLQQFPQTQGNSRGRRRDQTIW